MIKGAETKEYDRLTGLQTMNDFFDTAENFKDSQPEKVLPTMLFFDLQGMRFFNKNHGFEEGNLLLKTVADILSTHFGFDHCSRFGHDHFAVFTTSEEYEQKLIDIFAELENANNGKVLPIHVGVFICLDRDISTDTACDKAKYACDAIKDSPQSAFNIFNEKMQYEMNIKDYIAQNFKRALAEEWISVYYQPIIRSANGMICDEEALARWNDPIQGAISPAEFIPVLENNKSVYLLDLYILEHVLDKLKIQKEMGLNIVGQSVNLSRSDFDSCDIVEEVRRRVDDADIPRSKINIEITESTVGIDFDFMQSQVSKFRELGFEVWIDDFGSGYSSFDFLQSMKFDVMKIDMRFVQQYGKNEQNPIVLTELVNLALGLEMEVVAEGVETKEQLDFLNEIGCTKMQGFYYSKAIPMDQVFERYSSGYQIGYENPDESDYYETLGRINLNGLDASINKSVSAIKDHFETLPVAILEYNEENLTVARCNNSYKGFLRKFFGMNENDILIKNHTTALHNRKSEIFDIIKKCHMNDNKIIFEEKRDDNITIHAFLRYITTNPVTKVNAYTIVILNVKEETETLSYTHVANALSSDYVHLYYVDINTEKYIEYSPNTKKNDFIIERHGNCFFEKSKKEARKYIYENDRETFLTSFTKEKVLSAINDHGTFTMTYRMIIEEKPVYVNMKVVPIGKNGKHIIVGVNNIDAYMRQREEIDHIKQERISFARMNALSGNYIAFYVVNLESDMYVEYDASDDFIRTGTPQEGNDFFEDSIQNARDAVYYEDYDRFIKHFTKKNILRTIIAEGLFELTYRIMINEEPRYVSLRAAIVNEDDENKLIIGINDVDARVKREQSQLSILKKASIKANIDSLTGVKNKHAYIDYEEILNKEILEEENLEFAIVMTDLNNLKEVNDNYGHQVGDEYLKNGCRIICETFAHSPVFRIGGDEFVVVVRGRDYEELDSLLERLHDHNKYIVNAKANWRETGKNVANNVVIAYGAAQYTGERNVAAIFAKADHEMYQNKQLWKWGRKSNE